MEKGKSFLITGMVIFLILVNCIGTVSSASSTTPTNLVIDFDSTYVDFDLGRGDSGIINLVIENTGGQPAEKVEVWIPSTTAINVGKRLYLGRMDAGESKILPVTIRINENAKTGLNAVQVKIEYDGFDSDGDRENNQVTSWEIPVRVYADPSFQITPEKTTYFKDTLDGLILTAISQDNIKDLSVTLSSDCLTVIGSSRIFLGEVKDNEEFKIKYDIKPSVEGACSNILSFTYLDEEGDKVSDDVSLGINVEKAGVDFKIVNISTLSPSPGDTVEIKLKMKKVGKAIADDVALSLSLSDPFVPADTTEIYVGQVRGGETIDISFKIAIGWDAEIKVHSIPLTIEYKVGGTSYSVEKDIGLDVSGSIILEVINVETSGSSTRVEVANLGTRAAEGVKATLVVGSGAQLSSGTTQSASSPGGGLMIPGMRGTRGLTSQEGPSETPTTLPERGGGNQTAEPQYLVDYKSDIKASKDTTFTFDGVVSGTATLILEYTGPNNQRVREMKIITVGGVRSLTSGLGTTSIRSRTQGTNLTTYLLYGIIILIIVWIVYRKYKGERIVPEKLAKKLGR